MTAGTTAGWNRIGGMSGGTSIAGTTIGGRKTTGAMDGSTRVVQQMMDIEPCQMPNSEENAEL